MSNSTVTFRGTLPDTLIGWTTVTTICLHTYAWEVFTRDQMYVWVIRNCSSYHTHVPDQGRDNQRSWHYAKDIIRPLNGTGKLIQDILISSGCGSSSFPVHYYIAFAEHVRKTLS